MRRWALPTDRLLASRTRWLAACLLAALAMCWGVPVFASVLHGRVVGVSDGDSIAVLSGGRVTHKIRLAGIDAPERGQPWSRRSRQALADLVADRDVTVETGKTDRYGRTLGKVLVDGRDAGLLLVRAGLAWHYKAYQHEQTEEDRRYYAQAEHEARASAKGLWSDPSPVPPWEFRRARR
ncbi:thermonuclease family protein [Hydrogenophaga aquatica]